LGVVVGNMNDMKDDGMLGALWASLLGAG